MIVVLMMMAMGVIDDNSAVSVLYICAVPNHDNRDLFILVCNGNEHTSRY
jgi:hypothetical protein